MQEKKMRKIELRAPNSHPFRPRGNPHIHELSAHTVVFTDDQCDMILNNIDQSSWKDGAVGYRKDDGSASSTVDHKRRKVLTAHCPVNKKTHFPMANIVNAISEINSQMWQFDLVGIDFVNDPPLVLRYSETREDFFRWHQDFSGDMSQRKLGFSLQLSSGDSYEGGNLEFFPSYQKYSRDSEEYELRRTRGSLIVFPTYGFHRVTQITKGVRYTIVGWVGGPAIR